MNIELFKEFNSMLFTVLKKELVIYMRKKWFDLRMYIYLNGTFQIWLPNVNSYSFTRY